ncbi:MAG: TonB family protein [Deltaproteobacteria bacterium]|nr:TonB family protein [Deltaproteobacteria bacterium]
MRRLVSIFARPFFRRRRRRCRLPWLWLALLPALTVCELPPAPALSAVEPAPLRSELVHRSFDRSLAGEQGRDLSAAPYFHLGEGEVDALPLKQTRADVNIAGAIAQVKLTQVYQNSGRRTLEAIYVFPASTRAAVYAMKMTIGERVIEAKIDKRDQARAQYQQAMREGRTASLLEQQRPNVFTMSVGNIRPGDQIETELFYTELLLPEERQYEFVLPTVVGPRYSNGSERSAQGAVGTERWVDNPYTGQGVPPSYACDIEVTLRGGLPIRKLAANHELAVDYRDEREARIRLAEGERAGDRDFVLHYTLAGDQIESGLLLYPGADEQFFLLTMEPPERIAPAAVLPREYVFVVDVSGSMHGFPLETSKQLMRELLGQLRPDERFDIVLFAGGNAVLSPTSLPATPDSIERAIGWVDRQRGGGGTELLAALRTAFGIPRSDLARIVVLLSDGYVSVEQEAFELVRREMGDANLFAFGIGTSVNRHLIEGLARAGNGEPFVVGGKAQAEPLAARFARYVSAPLMRQISVEFKEFDVYDVEPEVLPDLFAERPLIVFGKYRGQPRGEIVVTGDAPGHDVEGRIKVADASLAEENGALRQLWARHRIARLADQNRLSPASSPAEEVTRLGLAYSLLTDYTSFVAIDSLVRGDGDSVRVDQPLPLPRGVSEHAAANRLARMIESGNTGTIFGGALGGELGGESYGFGGLGLRGTGSGGGGSAATTFGAASIGTYGRGGGSAGYGSGAGGLGGKADRGTSISHGAPVIMGSLDKQVIRRVIKENSSMIRYCYERISAARQLPAGRVVVKFVIAANGTVAKVEIAETTLNDAEVEACLLRAIRKWRFPKPAGGGVVVVSYPFFFK